MEAGTKLKCINRSGVLNLTLGKVYTTISEGNDMLFIINDAGNKCAYAIERFLVVKEDNEVSEEEEITLKLTKEDAQVLKSLLGMICGSFTKSYRKNTDKMYKKLRELGVESIEDFQSLVVFEDYGVDDDLKAISLLPTNHKEILAIEKQIEELQSKLTTLKGE